MKKNYYLTACLSLCVASIFLGNTYAQNAGLQDNPENLTVITPITTYPKEIALKYNDKKESENPDFGKLPYGELNGYFEVLSKRTSDSRFFRNIDEPNLFYIKKSSKPINYKVGEYWRAINSNLLKINEDIYTATQQPFPTILDVKKQRSGLKVDGKTLFFNDIEIKYTYLNGSTQIIQADWSNHTVGSDGVFVNNAFPNIDLKIIYKEGAVKSTYIIKQKLPNVQKMELIDQLDFADENFTILPYKGDTINGNYFGNIAIGLPGSSPFFLYEKIKIFDASGVKSHSFTAPYLLDNNQNEITTILNQNLLNNDTIVYPLYIDPTVTYGPFYAGGNKFSIDQIPNFCSLSMTMSFPGGATPTDFSTSWELHTGLDCYYPGYYNGWLSEVTVWMTSSCGGVTPVGAGISGTNVYGWSCSGACNTPGTWTPTLPFGASGCQSMVQCYTPSCAAQDMTFTFFDAGVAIWTACACTQYQLGIYESDIIIDSWSVSVQGRTLEATTDQTYNVATCSGTTTNLDPGPGYGVPGYTYAWSSGETTSTITANNAGSPYSVTVTDACGAQEVVNFTINCPLSVTLSNFTAEKINRRVLLQWETVSETDNDYFMVQRAGEDGQFYDLLKKDAVGNSNTLQNYSIFDENPLNGTSYYRLQIYDEQGNISTSEVKSVGFNGNNGLRIVPNPNNGTFQIAYNFPEKGIYLIELLSVSGKQFNAQKIAIDKAGYKEIKLENSALNKGVYFLKLHTQNQVIVKKVVVE